MNIAPNYNHQPNYQQNKTNFTSKLSATCKALGSGQTVELYKLDKKDIPCLEKILKDINKFFESLNITGESHQQVAEEAIGASVEILKGEKNPEKKAKIFLAVANEKPCGIIIGNASKTDKRGHLHYSSRKNHGSKETELDWLTAWGKGLGGLGKMLTTKYLSTLSKDGFRTAYVRSEIPSKSKAVDFYKSMGFRPMSESERLIQLPSENSYTIGTYDALEDTIIPMKMSHGQIKKTVTDMSEKLCMHDIESSKSIPLDKVIRY